MNMVVVTIKLGILFPTILQQTLRLGQHLMDKTFHIMQLMNHGDQD